jgi:hypothetical protein
MTRIAQSPDPHFQAKLSTIHTEAELTAFADGIREQRDMMLCESHAISVRFAEIKKGRR